MKIYRGFQIKAHPTSPMQLVIATDGKGGSIPSVLEGLFTSYTVAKGEIDAYLETKPKVEDGKKFNKAGAASGG